MNVDEFLDKEIQAEKKEDIEKRPVPIEVTKEERDIIKHYFELWNKVSEVKFKWDNELYTELNKSAKKVKDRIDKLLPTIKREKGIIKQLIEKAVSELERGKYESATRLYSEISDMRNSIPDFLLEEKKELNKEIFQLYEKLHDKIDSKFINDFNDSIVKVENLIRNSFSSLRIGRLEPAKDFYENALEVYITLPNGFLAQKIELGEGLLTLYKELSLHLQIKKLQQQLAKKSTQGYKFKDSDDNLKVMSEIIKNKVKASEEKLSKFSDLGAVSAQEQQHVHNKTLLTRLIARKLDRAKINLKKGLYKEAKKNINAILKVDSDNAEAKQLLDSLPVEY